MKYGGQLPDGAVSSYNEAAVMMFRLHEFQRIFGLHYLTPHNLDQEHGIYNYIICVNALKYLYGQVRSKCKKQEKIDAEKLIKELEDETERNHVFIPMKGESGQIKYYLNKENWRRLLALIDKTHYTIKDLMEHHGYGSPNAEDPSIAMGLT